MIKLDATFYNKFSLIGEGEGVVGEKDLIKDLRRGKEDAYYELLSLYGDKLLKTCFLMIRDENEAEDIVQETFIKVFKSIKNFKGESSLYTWIYRIAQNMIKDRYSTRILTIPYEDYQANVETIEEIIISEIDREILRNQLNNLNFIYTQVLTLFYFEDLSIKEICEILDEKEGTIKSKLSRGRQLLKTALERGGELNG